MAKVIDIEAEIAITSVQLDAMVSALSIAMLHVRRLRSSVHVRLLESCMLARIGEY